MLSLELKLFSETLYLKKTKKTKKNFKTKTFNSWWQVPCHKNGIMNSENFQKKPQQSHLYIWLHRVVAEESSASTATDTNTSFATLSTTKQMIAKI